jgi:hypothetical protein
MLRIMLLMLSYGNIECQACERGTYANEVGSVECKPCELAHFQNVAGQVLYFECRSLPSSIHYQSGR